MGGTRRLSIITSVRLTLVAMLASVVLAGFLSHALIEKYDDEGARIDAVRMMAEVLATQLRADVARSPDELQRACDRLLEHPAVQAVCLWDQSGVRAAAAAVRDELLTIMDSQRKAAMTGVTVEPVEPASPFAAQEARMLSVNVPLGAHYREQRPGRLGLLIAAPPAARGAWTHVLFFYLPLGVTAMAAGFLASRRLRRRIFRPIRLLVEAAGADRGRGPSAFPADREDELGEIARSLRTLREDLDTWRHRAELIERRVDSRIATKTQRITQDLRRIQREAWRDPLTGVKNRRVLEEKLPEIFLAQHKARQDLSVVMLDLDGFKALNDSLGHAAGDEILTFVGELLRQCLRSDDITVRFGGDEFVLILPCVPYEEALFVTRRIIALYGQRAKMLARSQSPPTMSAGIASLRHNSPADHAELLAMADQALYAAKRAGGGQACVFRGVCLSSIGN